MKLKLLAFIMLFLSCNWSLAQRQWEQTNGPYGANVESIVVSQDGKIYASTNAGIYRSDDNGNSWLKLDGSPTGTYGWDKHKLAVDNEGNIFVLIGGGLYRSSDSGITWELIFDLVSQIVFDSSGNIFIGGASIYVSRDNGDTWILQNEIETNDLVINRSDHLLAVVKYNQLFLSTDAGISWASIGTPDDGTFIRSIATNSRDEIFVETESGVYMSPDNGSSWEPILDIVIYTENIFINSNDDIFYYYFDKGLYRSSDNGDTWDIISEGIPWQVVSTIAFDSVNNIYAGTAIGVYISSNNGDQWILSNKGLNSTIPSLDINNKGDLFVARYSNLFRSTDKGDNWTSIYQAQHDTVIESVQIKDNGDIYMIEYELIFDTPWVNGILRRSRDNGDTWDIIFDENDSEIRCLSFNEGKINIVTDYGWYVSDDDGETFIMQPEPEGFLCNTIVLPSGTLIRPNLIDSNVIWKSTIEKSIDNGVTWIRTIILDNPDHLHGVQVESNSQGHLFIASFIDYVSSDADTSFLLRSTDEGIRWDTIFYNDSVLIKKVHIDNFDNLYLATSNGIYLSRDNGDNWSTINEGLEVTYVFDIQVDISSDILYTTPSGSGLWKNELMVNTGKPIRNLDFSVYPNPTLGIITINLPGIMLPSNTRLDIFNIQGMLVKSITMMNSQLTVDVSDLTPGPYLLNISGMKKGQIVILK